MIAPIVEDIGITMKTNIISWNTFVKGMSGDESISGPVGDVSPKMMRSAIKPSTPKNISNAFLYFLNSLSLSGLYEDRRELV